MGSRCPCFDIFRIAYRWYAHYLISLYNFILSRTDSSRLPRTVLIALIDFSKAFNRINYSKVLVRLSDWCVPGWLLKILLSYLTDRNMILRYKGVNSSRYFMPGGSPQGTLLGVLLYLVYVSDIGMNLPPLEQISTSTYDIQSIPYPPPLPTSESECRLKYVDDLTLGECVNLQHQLQHDGTDYHLPPEKSLLQKRLNDLSLAAKTHDMKLNLSKTKVLSFIQNLVLTLMVSFLHCQLHLNGCSVFF